MLKTYGQVGVLAVIGPWIARVLWASVAHGKSSRNHCRSCRCNGSCLKRMPAAQVHVVKSAATWQIGITFSIIDAFSKLSDGVLTHVFTANTWLDLAEDA